ncbi:MAG: hypothetical protein ICV62_06200 [Cyanobacteria bacterium Co-bin13]|nr:hypothetical protein [Cyanobacteria bacterium Co-bin13]
MTVGSITVQSTTVLPVLIGFLVGFSLILYYRKQRSSRRPVSIEPLPKASASTPRFIKAISWLGLGLLLVIVVHRANTYQGASPTDSLLIRLVYNPTPSAVASPWPWKDQQAIHPAVAAMPPAVETNIKSVAAYLSQQESDPYLQVKAIHDYVVSRLSYDLQVLQTGIRPSQDAARVFRTHRAVCEGYANLFTALAQAMGLEVAYVRGSIRRDLAPLDLIPGTLRLTQSDYNWTLHAWNAVKIEDSWQLVDTTWDDATDSDEASFYSADYLMLPPEVMIKSHLPEHTGWQLLPQTVDRKTFEAKPILRPQFFAEGLSLIEPTGYKTEVPVTAQADSPQIQLSSLGYPHQLAAIFIPAQTDSAWLATLAHALGSNRAQQTAADAQRCQSLQNQETTQIFCPFPKPGLYEVLLFSLDKDSESFLGQLKFQVL